MRLHTRLIMSVCRGIHDDSMYNLQQENKFCLIASLNKCLIDTSFIDEYYSMPHTQVRIDSTHITILSICDAKTNNKCIFATKLGSSSFSLIGISFIMRKYESRGQDILGSAVNTTIMRCLNLRI
jgi:hypothetical protein